MDVSVITAFIVLCKRYCRVIVMLSFVFCILSCQPRVTVMSCFVYKVIRD